LAGAGLCLFNFPDECVAAGPGMDQYQVLKPSAAFLKFVARYDKRSRVAIGQNLNETLNAFPSDPMY
jgi:hypothetical protein